MPGKNAKQQVSKKRMDAVQTSVASGDNGEQKHVMTTRSRGKVVTPVCLKRTVTIAKQTKQSVNTGSCGENMSSAAEEEIQRKQPPRKSKRAFSDMMANIRPNNRASPKQKQPQEPNKLPNTPTVGASSEVQSASSTPAAKRRTQAARTVKVSVVQQVTNTSPGKLTPANRLRKQPVRNSERVVTETSPSSSEERTQPVVRTLRTRQITVHTVSARSTKTKAGQRKVPARRPRKFTRETANRNCQAIDKSVSRGRKRSLSRTPRQKTPNKRHARERNSTVTGEVSVHEDHASEQSPMTVQPARSEQNRFIERLIQRFEQRWDQNLARVNQPLSASSVPSNSSTNSPVVSPVNRRRSGRTSTDGPQAAQNHTYHELPASGNRLQNGSRSDHVVQARTSHGSGTTGTSGQLPTNVRSSDTNAISRSNNQWLNTTRSGYTWQGPGITSSVVGSNPSQAIPSNRNASTLQFSNFQPPVRSQTSVLPLNQPAQTLSQPNTIGPFTNRNLPQIQQVNISEANRTNQTLHLSNTLGSSSNGNLSHSSQTEVSTRNRFDNTRLYTNTTEQVTNTNVILGQPILPSATNRSNCTRTDSNTTAPVTDRSWTFNRPQHNSSSHRTDFNTTMPLTTGGSRFIRPQASSSSNRSAIMRPHSDTQEPESCGNSTNIDSVSSSSTLVFTGLGHARADCNRLSTKERARQNRARRNRERRKRKRRERREMELNRFVSNRNTQAVNESTANRSVHSGRDSNITVSVSDRDETNNRRAHWSTINRTDLTRYNSDSARSASSMVGSHNQSGQASRNSAFSAPLSFGGVTHTQQFQSSTIHRSDYTRSHSSGDETHNQPSQSLTRNGPDLTTTAPLSTRNLTAAQPVHTSTINRPDQILPNIRTSWIQNEVHTRPFCGSSTNTRSLTRPPFNSIGTGCSRNVTHTQPPPWSSVNRNNYGAPASRFGTYNPPTLQYPRDRYRWNRNNQNNGSSNSRYVWTREGANRHSDCSNTTSGSNRENQVDNVSPETCRGRSDQSDDDCIILSPEPPSKKSFRLKEASDGYHRHRTSDADVMIVEDIRPPEDLVRKARALGLPDTFYNYLKN